LFFTALLLAKIKFRKGEIKYEEANQFTLVPGFGVLRFSRLPARGTGCDDRSPDHGGSDHGSPGNRSTDYRRSGNGSADHSSTRYNNDDTSAAYNRAGRNRRPNKSRNNQQPAGRIRLSRSQC